ncbi:P-loop containing nucleoside triphosphate hydrolase protein [Clohesyomyces aquaticus]|uniref:p-loop containing nucleoside triphosphate hydrolase protein n=1 Tax=Clohesyomyces aquaticus TaxID=1231657 RepID=A0A1Y1YLH3_9PLEO|nr:P-loop containing nucleoside triphosphate hydrolase protein [Clohesyomyces aquaticus]
MTGNSFQLHANEDQTAREYYHHSSGQRINTDIVLVQALRSQYPELDVVAVPASGCNLLAFASSGHATATPLEGSKDDSVYGSVSWRSYYPPARRLDSSPGVMVERLIFGKYLYKYEKTEAIVYIASGRDGSSYYPEITVQYILTRERHKIDDLIKQATLWGTELHNEVWVFDGGYWQKSAELWQSVQKSRWEDVILDEDMKKALISDVENFFDGRDTYENLKVPWKRGIIYYGPPGNGKTISIKAMMHSLYQRSITKNGKMSVPTLYVRTLSSFAGPEYSLAQIFHKAREVAPCYLVFEDLDSIVDDRVRSYFLNEVDGLKSNDGILMVGSTNHLDRLDPGISKRPSRFDRKYFFPDPSFEQRVMYARFWQGKLKSNDEVEFPDEMCEAVAKITDKFSFAYMQEAFVAALLAIAVRSAKGAVELDENKWSGPHGKEGNLDDQLRGLFHTLGGGDIDDPKLDKLELWREFQKQVKILREEMDEKKHKEIWGAPVKETQLKPLAPSPGPRGPLPPQYPYRHAAPPPQNGFKRERSGIPFHPPPQAPREGFGFDGPPSPNPPAMGFGGPPPQVPPPGMGFGGPPPQNPSEFGFGAPSRWYYTCGGGPSDSTQEERKEWAKRIEDCL